MDRLSVRLGRTEDVIAIIALIEDYFARRQAPPQYREIGTWYVAEFDGQICAAQNWLDTGPAERWLLDTYCYNSRGGLLCLGELMRFTHAQADADRVALLGISEPDNVSVGKTLNAHGWVDVGILRRREPGAAYHQKRNA